MTRKHPRDARPSRRAVLGAGVLGTAGLGIGAATQLRSTPGRTADSPTGSQTEPFDGVHQAGIATPPQANAAFLGFDLAGKDARDSLRRLLLVWTEDGRRLTRGAGGLTDQEPELAATPARLTLTVALGPRVFASVLPHVQGSCPALPPLTNDALQDEWAQTDVLLQVCADDPVTVSHAARILTRTAGPLTTLRWRQDGFRNARGSLSPGTTQRNLFGQLDGTVNPTAGSEDFDTLVWISSGALAGGSQLVLRRISMDLDTWDQVGRAERELSVGRTLDTGAPLGGRTELDGVDLEARDTTGQLIIPADAHVRRAMPRTPTERFLRRGYNYEGTEGAGLLFVAYQADMTRQFLPVQRRLDASDALNKWTRAIGSSSYTVLPGCLPGEVLGASLGLHG